MNTSTLVFIQTAFNLFNSIGIVKGGGVTRLGYTEKEDEMHDALHDSRSRAAARSIPIRSEILLQPIFRKRNLTF
jgi:hypothetical protein